MSPSTKTLALLGAGKVGTALTLELIKAGYGLAGLWDPSGDALAASALRWGRLPLAASAIEAASRAGLILIAVPDDALNAVVLNLAEGSLDWRHRVVAHTSGRYGSSILGPIEEHGALTVAVHPAMAFSGDTEADRARVAGTWFAVTGSTPAAQEAGARLVSDLSAVPFPVAEMQRSLYHAALAHGSNHIVTLVLQAAEILRAAGIDSPASVLRPLLEAALDNALRRGALGATGPVVRGDAGTVREHVAALSRSVPESLPAYRALTEAGIAIARSTGRITDAQAKILQENVLAPSSAA